MACFTRWRIGSVSISTSWPTTSLEWVVVTADIAPWIAFLAIRGWTGDHVAMTAAITLAGIGSVHAHRRGSNSLLLAGTAAYLIAALAVTAFCSVEGALALGGSLNIAVGTVIIVTALANRPALANQTVTWFPPTAQFQNSARWLPTWRTASWVLGTHRVLIGAFGITLVVIADPDDVVLARILIGWPAGLAAGLWTHTYFMKRIVRPTSNETQAIESTTRDDKV